MTKNMVIKQNKIRRRDVCDNSYLNKMLNNKTGKIGSSGFTHFLPLVSFYTTSKHQKTSSFLFSGGEGVYRQRPIAWKELWRCIWNQKVSDLLPNGCLARLRDLTSLKDSQWPPIWNWATVRGCLIARGSKLALGWVKKSLKKS